MSWVLEVLDEYNGVWEAVHHVHNYTGHLNREFFDVEYFVVQT